MDLPAVQAPTIGASGTQQRRRSNQETPRYQIGTKGKLPSPSRHQENPACGCRCGARAASASRASPLPTILTLPAGLPSIPSILSSPHSCCLAPRRRRAVQAQHRQAFEAGAPRQRLLHRAQARALFARLLTNPAGAPTAAIPQHSSSACYSICSYCSLQFPGALIADRRHLSSAAAPLSPPPSFCLRPRALIAARRHLSSAAAPSSPPPSQHNRCCCAPAP